MNIDEIMQVMTLVGIILAFYWTHRSFPPEQTAELLKELAEASAKTENRLDDLIIALGSELNQLRLNDLKEPDEVSP